jgi:2-oxo-hept-3-ene-1,7-dioate hydratase
MTVTAEEIRAAAHALDEAERGRRQIPLLSRGLAGLDMDAAYAIQAEWTRMKRERGDGVVGWKIGLTSKAMQAALGIDIPDSGVLFESMMFENGGTVARDRFIQPRVEAEIAFVMKTALTGVLSTDAILDATDYIAPAIEILDTRIARKDPSTGQPRTVLDTIADNAANAGIVMGTPVRDFAGRALRWLGAIVSRDGVVEETGLGAGVLGDPRIAVAWLAERLAAYGGTIEAGQIVLSGSFIRPIEAPPGSVISADFGELGTVSCHF